jgi:hypothetical protein
LRGDAFRGWLDRQTLFSVHPLHGKLLEAELEITKARLGTRIDLLAEAFASPDDLREPLSLLDQIFLNNPDAMHHRLDVEDLSPGIRERRFVIVMPTHFSAAFEAMGLEKG